MTTWINGIRHGELAPSIMFASEQAAERALKTLLAHARHEGFRIRHDEVADFYVWTVRDDGGAIVESWWLSAEEHGPAMRNLGYA